MRTLELLEWARRVFVVLLAIAPHAAAAFEPGDLLVSYGDEILRVDSVTGQSSRFSPPPFTFGSEIDANGTDQIAIDANGAIFVVSGGQVIQINPVTGVQSVLHKRTLVCVQLQCGYLEDTLELGPSPRGIDVDDTGTHLDLLVGCFDNVYRIHRSGGNVSSQEAWFDQLDFAFDPLLVAAVSGTAMVADRDLHTLGFPPAPVIFEGLGVPATITALDSYGGTVVFATHIGGNPAGAGVYYGWGGGFLPLTQGGYLRRPVGVAVDPERADRIWVADAGADSEPGNRLIRLDYDGLDWRQTVFAELPSYSPAEVHGIAVWPADEVPEPGVFALESAACGALACVGLAKPRA
jgi:hypothetical protein